MGAKYIDYIVADESCDFTNNQHEAYSEKIIYFSTQQLSGETITKRSIADRVFTRTELGLPPTGFVFCCFNNNYKITPHVFDCWMRILKASQRDSVLVAFRR